MNIIVEEVVILNKSKRESTRELTMSPSNICPTLLQNAEFLISVVSH